jgi:hypothetical protein
VPLATPLLEPVRLPLALPKLRGRSFQDGFTADAAGTTPPAGWTQLSGVPYNFTVTPNGAEATANTASDYVASISGSDWIVETEVFLLQGAAELSMQLAQNSTNRYIAGIGGFNRLFALGKEVAGTFTALGETSASGSTLSVGTRYLQRLQKAGATLSASLWANGVWLAGFTVTDSSLAGPFSPGIHSGTNNVSPFQVYCRYFRAVRL